MHQRLPSASLLRQKRNQKRNVRFNIMVAGVGGCGKSTLINTLCRKELASSTEWLDKDPANAHREHPIRLRTYHDDILDPEIGNIDLRIIETSGFGDSLNNTASLYELLHYIEQQFDEVLVEESRIKRNPRFIDNRLHALIYVIEASGKGLREIDVEFLRMVGPRINVIPVLGKADTLTSSEAVLNKELVRRDIERYEISVYHFADLDMLEPFAGNEYDGDDRRYAASAPTTVQESVPFAVIGSNNEAVDESGRPVLVRQYPWGTINVEDPSVSDMALLRELVLYSHLADLKETTDDILYEAYRTQRLSSEGDLRSTTMTTNAGAATNTATSMTGAASQLGGNADGSGTNMSATGVAISAGTPQYLEREEQLRAEEERLLRHEQNIQGELEQRRKDLRRREAELQELEVRLKREADEIGTPIASGKSKF